MVIWIADSCGFDKDYGSGCKRTLISFAYLNGRNEARDWIDSRPVDAEVFLDSGAFGVSTGKAKIDVDQYCDYILENGAKFTHYASLDVIGDWRASARNYERMRERGLFPVQTFHKGSPWYELERILSCDDHLIAFGGMAGKGTSQTIAGLGRHLDRAWSIVRGRWPVRVHAFGVIGQEILQRYPFYSADSAGPLLTGGMGRVMEFSRGQMQPGEHWLPYSRRTLDLMVMDRPERSQLVADRDAKAGDLIRIRGGMVADSLREGRARRNIQAVLRMERHLTSMWEARGVSWSDTGAYIGTVH